MEGPADLGSAPDAEFERPSRICPAPVGQMAQGSDFQQGAFFNRTRLLIRAETLAQTRIPDAHGVHKPLTAHHGMSLQVGRKPGLHSLTPKGSATGADPSLSLPRKGEEDYLQSLLPSSGFQGGEEGDLLPAPGFGMPASGLSKASGAVPPDSILQEQQRPALQSESSKDTSERDQKEQDTEDSSERDTSQDENGDVSGDLRINSEKPGFMATYQYQQVTADGGVALAFDNLEGSADPEDLDRLAHAIDALVSEQQQHVVIPALEEAVAREMQALSRLHESLRDKRPLQGQLGAPLADAGFSTPSPEPQDGDGAELTGRRSAPAGSGDAAAKTSLPPVIEEDGRPSDNGSAHPSAALQPLPVRSSGAGKAASTNGTPAAALSQVPLPPLEKEREDAGISRAGSKALDKALAHVIISDGVKPDDKQDEKIASIKQERLVQKLASLKEQLTATIQLGFQQGRFKSLNIAILVVGTRGDVQPFVGIALKLKEFGHRVRIASHAVYREFVTGFGLEFYPLGGDPKVLSEFVVKHRGIMPGWNISDALNQREQVREILYSTWGACTAADPKRPDKPFRADAIIANPPSYGHTHCAEALNVPLHVVFTMPWTPTKAFPQPFARIRTNMVPGQNSKAREVMNWMSYFAMEDLAWLGMAGMQKDFRQRVLGLQSWNKYTTSHAIYYSQVPLTYIWSPSLVPRPADWPTHCEVVGFCNVELRKLTSYTPPDDLKNFLDAGPPPVYIGFGSLVVDQPAMLTQQFLAALERTGLRAIIQRGWGGLGGDYGLQPSGQPGKKPPSNVLFIDSAPHDWLFQCVSAVVHHGGAGTTASGLMAGKPTFIVPFFGDQPFWGAACEKAGVGPAPVPIDDLTTEKIVDALKELILPTRQKAAVELSKRMLAEDGISAAVDHIHRSIYTTLLGKNTPIWMQNAKPKGQATTSIQEMEDEQGGGFLRGMLQLPTRIFRGITGRPVIDTPQSHRGSQPNLGTLSSQLSPGSASSVISSPSYPPALRQVEVIGGEVQRKSFFSFLGC